MFNFDIDVIPLLTVIVGKTIEQALLELEQEEEIANLREAKKMFAHHKNDDNKRIKNLEEREIQKKYNNGSYKKGNDISKKFKYRISKIKIKTTNAICIKQTKTICNSKRYERTELKRRRNVF